jgi:putative GTP pyrophosphokinase
MTEELKAETKGHDQNWEKEYLQLRPRLEDFARRIKSLIGDLLQKIPDLKVHTVESRVKTPGSLADKVSRPGKAYSDPLREVSDLVGLRIVAYYADDVTKITEMIRAEFSVIDGESQDTSKRLAPDQFGYLSVHHVVNLSNSRGGLAEWSDFKNVKMEIQVRTVLQHAWAAISHALQYKQDADVPDELKRRLYRLAGLLEIADEQFISLRDGHAALVETIVNQFDMGVAEVPVNTVSAREFVERSGELGQVCELATLHGYSVDVDEAYHLERALANIVILAREADLNRVEDLQASLEAALPLSETFLAEIKEDGPWHVSPSFLLLLLLVLAHVDKVPEGFLVEIFGWNEDIAERVTASAKQLSPRRGSSE